MKFAPGELRDHKLDFQAVRSGWRFVCKRFEILNCFQKIQTSSSLCSPLGAEICQFHWVNNLDISRSKKDCSFSVGHIWEEEASHETKLIDPCLLWPHHSRPFHVWNHVMPMEVSLHLASDFVLFFKKAPRIEILTSCLSFTLICACFRRKICKFCWCCWTRRPRHFSWDVADL